MLNQKNELIFFIKTYNYFYCFDSSNLTNAQGNQKLFIFSFYSIVQKFSTKYLASFLLKKLKSYRFTRVSSSLFLLILKPFFHCRQFNSGVFFKEMCTVQVLSKKKYCHVQICEPSLSYHL